MNKINSSLIIPPILIITTILISVFIFKMQHYEMFNKELCFEKKCIDSVMKIVQESWGILTSIVEVIAYTLTSFGIFFAAMSYRLSEKTSKTMSHIENFKLFDQFIKTEVENSPHLSLKSFNAGKIYKSIYPQSREGLFNVGDNFSNFIKELSAIIEASSNSIKNGNDFNYTNHQNKIINIFNTIGISVTNLHRMDFWYIEKDLLNVINSISSNFIYDDSLQITSQIKYR